MKFAHPAWLILAASAIPAGVLAEIARRASVRRLKALGGRPGSGSFRRRVLLPAAALALLAGAAAGPTWGYRDVPARAAETDLVVAFDTSGSMLTRDLAPDRFSVARRFARELLRQVPSEVRVALVRMEGEGEVVVPLTLDRAAVVGALDELSARGAVQPGSDLGDGLKKAAALLSARDARSRAILLISDGEDLDQGLDPAGKECAERRIPIDTVCAGTTTGGPVPARGGGFVRDSSGQTVVSRAHPDVLGGIAAKTGGRAIVLGRAMSSPSSIAAAVAKLAREGPSRTSREPADRSAIPLFLGFITACLSLAPARSAA